MLNGTAKTRCIESIDSAPRPSNDPLDSAPRQANDPLDSAPRASNASPWKHPRPPREEALQAVRTLLAYIGEDPSREGLLETPDRVLRAYGEFFAGYGQRPEEVLARTFDEVGGYDDMVVVRDIPFQSHCEHHMVPFHGVAHVGYLPQGRVVGLSKLARVVEIFARRLQVQEKLTVQIAESIQACLKPRGVGVMIEAQHECMCARGVRKPGAMTLTTRTTGEIDRESGLREEFLRAVRRGR